MDIPRDLKIFLLEIKKRLLMQMKDNIRGIYVYGSLSYGDFEESRSDVDVIVFLDARLDEKGFGILKGLYEKPQIRNSKWISKLEMDYVSIEDMKPLKNIIGTACFRGGSMVHSRIEGLSMELSNILECGISLYGPEPSAFIPEISETLLDEALLNKFIHIKENEPKWSKIDFWNQVFIIVQLCRIIYSVKNKTYVVSKKKATQWCSDNISQFSSIIDTALKGLDNWERPIDEEIRNELPRFLRFTEKILFNRLKRNDALSDVLKGHR